MALRWRRTLPFGGRERSPCRPCTGAAWGDTMTGECWDQSSRRQLEGIQTGVSPLVFDHAINHRLFPKYGTDFLRIIFVAGFDGDGFGYPALVTPSRLVSCAALVARTQVFLDAYLRRGHCSVGRGHTRCLQAGSDSPRLNQPVLGVTRDVTCDTMRHGSRKECNHYRRRFQGWVRCVGRPTNVGYDLSSILEVPCGGASSYLASKRSRIWLGTDHQFVSQSPRSNVPRCAWEPNTSSLRTYRCRASICVPELCKWRDECASDSQGLSPVNNW